MREIFDQLRRAIEANRQVTYCRLVETRGSTPQKAGATMLVFADGSQVGTLGGGCVEAEAKRSALAALEQGAGEVKTFQLDNDYGWDDGLICGGRMKILLQPINSDQFVQYFRLLSELIGAGEGVTEAIVFDQEASGLPAPQSFLFDSERRLVAAVQDHTAENVIDTIGKSVRQLATRPRPYAAEGVAFLPVLPRCRLLIVGGGHVGKAVADLAATLDFEVWVVDDRADIISPERFPHAKRRIVGDIDQVLPEIEITPNTFCLIVTRGHNHDEQALFHLVDRDARYVGLIGSRRKIRLIYEDLLGEGVSQASLERVHAPLGIDIGSQTVPEIAVSICAELVAHRNLAGEVPGRPRSIFS